MPSIKTMPSKIIAGLPEAIIPNCLSLMITGILGACITAQFGGFGILTFVQVATLGVSAASLSEYQTDRGEPKAEPANQPRVHRSIFVS